MIHFLLLFSRHGKIRLKKWFTPMDQASKTKIARDVIPMILARKPRMCNVIEWKEYKMVYKRYASLFFLASIDPDDNELITLEMVHRYVGMFRQGDNQLDLFRLMQGDSLLHWVQLLRGRLVWIHRVNELLDAYFGNVCELDIIFNFQQAYYILDELLVAGELQESSKSSVLRTTKRIEQAEAEDGMSDILKAASQSI